MHTLNIVVVGAGIGGLATAYLLGRAGHNVTVLESAQDLTETGAGIQLTPNVTRLLIRWGLAKQLKDMAVVPQMLSLRRYENGELVGWRELGSSSEREHGSPYYHIHRADLYTLLLNLARPHASVRVNSKVISVDPHAPSVTLSSGQVIHADLVVGADGLKSCVRDVVVGAPDGARPTGDAAFRAVLQTERMMQDPDLRALVEEGGVTVWMGPGRHIVGYCVRSKKEYNLVMLHPSTDTDENTVDVDCEVMRKVFVGFEERVQKLLKLVPSTLVWSLMDRDPLDSWVHQDGKVCLLGDACHPMLPYRAQGAAMAIEDAAVLGNLLSRLPSLSHLADFLHTYQKMRYPRATEAQLGSRMNQKIFHLPDGKEQEARDESMRFAMEAALKEARGEEADDCVGSQNMWADKVRSGAVFGYDADEEVDAWWSSCKL